MNFVCAPRRVRLANSKAHNALGDISTGAPPSPLTAWPENAPAGTMASSTATQLAQAQREADAPAVGTVRKAVQQPV